MTAFRKWLGADGSRHLVTSLNKDAALESIWLKTKRVMPFVPSFGYSFNAPCNLRKMSAYRAATVAAEKRDRARLEIPCQSHCG